MKDKLFTALKTKFEGVQDAILIRIAEKLSKTVTEDSHMDTAIAGVTMQKLLESYGDSRATEAVVTHEKTLKDKFDFVEKGQEPKPPTTPHPTVPQKTDDPLLKVIDDLNKRLSGFEAEKKQQVLIEKLHTQLKEKKIPVLLAEGIKIEKEEDLPGVMEKIEANHNTIKQDMVNNGLVTETPFDGVPRGTEASVAADIKRLAGKF